MEFAELSNVDKLRRLFEAFTAKRDILHLLDQSLQGRRRADLHRPGIRLPRSWTTTASSPRRTCWTSETVGVLGVIGPTRMAYERVIPIVRHDGADARHRLEFPPLASIMCPVAGPARQRQRAGTSPIYHSRGSPSMSSTADDDRVSAAGATPVGRPGGRGRGAAGTPWRTSEARAQEHRDNYVRAVAEMDNVRKRTAREIEPRSAMRVEKLGRRPARGRATAWSWASPPPEPRPSSLTEGMEATLRLLDKAFEQAGISVIDPQGAAVQPRAPRGDGHPGRRRSRRPARSLPVVQKGYQLNGRLLRPARVIVARQPI